MANSQEFFGPNAGYVAELWERYQADPALVDPDTRRYFDAGVYTPPALNPTGNGIAQAVAAPIDVTKIVAAARLGRIVRELGHLEARVDPLGSDPPSDPALSLEAHGLTTDDLLALPATVIGGPLSRGAANALAALAKLRRAYSGAVGYEDDHVQVAEERDWLRNAVETGRFFQNFGPSEKREVLERLTEVDGFEQFLQKTPPFQGQKRFSIEGIDMMVPLLDAIIRCTAQAETREVVIGMAHRGRLNVLAHILNKPYEAILSEFPGTTSTPTAPQQASVAGSGALGYTGDVKYHKGYRRDYTSGATGHMPITLAPNPSHLEFVDPAVVGRARAAQENRDHAGVPVHDSKASLAILIHGDAAFPGQGVVPETLNMSQLKGYAVGGTIHLIANNQIGFTTNPGDGRSTLYASDLAKGFEIPIVHVNADDPEACIAVAKMACAYREQFGKDFLIDLIGYRRMGHNETDEPSFTQPRMYEKIRQHPRPREVWAAELDRQHIVSKDEADAMVKRVQARLLEAKANVSAAGATRNPDAHDDEPDTAPPVTAIDEAEARALNALLVGVPDGFTVNPKVAQTVLAPRRAALDTPNGVLWAHGEALAFAAILHDGTPIRLTGQDSERGTFGHRHIVLNDPTTGAKFCALQRTDDTPARASFAVYNSPLSETAALGFEYGYSVHAANTLVLWEAQFGDFANGAQVIIDQFIASGNAKWGQSPSVVLLLPHGYEGQGPEHSSARIERFLQLCAGDSMRVVNCTTAAQYFHLLRRQAGQLTTHPRPLVVMTPKSLLRHPRAASSLADFTSGTFRPVLDDPRDPARKAQVSRLVLCSGKIAIELTTGAGPAFAPRPEYEAADGLAVARVEELNPFPATELSALMASYPNLAEVVWTQEEPRNMGAWSFVRHPLGDLLPEGVALRYIGRPTSASPAEGSQARHDAEQSRIIREALGGALVCAPAAPTALPKTNKNGTNGRNGTNGTHANTAAPAVNLTATKQPEKDTRE